jgi:hypothetical protein
VSTTFTIEQARELIPWLQQTFDAMQPLIGKLENLTHEANRRSRQMRSDGGGEAEEESTEAQKARQEVEREIRQLVDAIVDKGILIKDPRRGLFDFPYEMQGDLVYLCWLAGEPEISYWHTVDSGFAGRQLL